MIHAAVSDIGVQLIGPDLPSGQIEVHERVMSVLGLVCVGPPSVPPPTLKAFGTRPVDRLQAAGRRDASGIGTG